MNDLLKKARRRLRGCRTFIVPYCHPDWAWTHTRHWHELRYVLAMEEVLDILNQQDRAGVPADAAHAFRWYMDVFCTQYDLFRRQRPGRLKELRRRVAEGRIAVCGAYSNVRVNHVEGETFLRSLVYGRRAFAEEFPGADLNVHADSVDTAVGYPQLPQLLTQAGYRYFQFWRPNDALHAKGVPYYFVWEGLDGTRILCNRGSYGGIVAPAFYDGYQEEWDKTFAAWWEHLLEDRAGHSPENILTTHHGCDDARPLRMPPHSDAPVDLPGVIEVWNQREASSLEFATPVDVFAALEPLRADLPVFEGTLDPCDVAYNAAWFGSRGLWKLRSECARAILAAETLGVMGESAGAGNMKPRQIRAGCESLWKDTLLFSAHAIQWLFQNDYDEIYALAESTLFAARRRQQRAVESLATKINAPSNTLSVHFNTLPHSRHVTVPLRVTFVEGDRGGVPESLRLLDGDGNEIPYQELGQMGRGLERWEIDTLVQLSLPAGGWNVVRWEAEKPSFAPSRPDNSNLLENDCLRLHFHLGRLMKIVDKATGKAWDAPVETPFGHLRASEVDTTARLHVGPILGRQDACWRNWCVTEHGPVRWALRAEGKIGSHPAALEVRLYRGQKRIEFLAEIDWQGMDGFLASQTPYRGKGRLFGDMPFCVEEKDLASEPYVGIERGRLGQFTAQSFVDWTDGKCGLAYISHDGDRYYILDQAQHTLQHILINSVRRPAGTWEEHVNRQMEGEGHHAFTYSLVPHTGTWQDCELWRLANELRTAPLQSWPGPRGRLPAAHSLLEVSPANVTVSACYFEGGQIRLRLFENAGRATAAKIQLPARPEKVQAVDLLGDPMPSARIKRRGNTLTLELKPWQIVTLSIIRRG